MNQMRTVQYTGPDSDVFAILNNKSIVYVVTSQYLDYDLPVVVIALSENEIGIVVRADEVKDVRHYTIKTAAVSDSFDPFHHHADPRLDVIPFTMKFVDEQWREAEGEWIEDNMMSLM